MPLLALELLPEVLAGLVLSAAVAAMMSTVDSQILVAVGAVVRDVYEKLLGGHPSDTVAVWLSRLVIIVLGAGGIIMAWEKSNVFKEVLDAWGGLAAGLGPAIILACLWKGTSRTGVIVGMVAGVLLYQMWNPLMAKLTAAAGPFATIAECLDPIGFVVCFLVNLILAVLFSWVLSTPPIRPDASQTPNPAVD